MLVEHPTAENPSTAKLIGFGLLFSLPLAVVALLPGKIVVLVLAGLGAVAGLVFLAVTAGRLVPAVLYLALLALVNVPIDKYFAYQEHVGGWPGIRIAAADLCLLALVPLAVLERLTTKSRNPIPVVVLFFYGLWLIQYLISSVGAPYRNLAFFEVAAASHALALALICAALFKREYITPVLVLVAAQVLLHTSFATIQVATGRPIGAGLGAGPASVVMESFETGEARLRPSGLFDHPIMYANFLMIGLPILAAGTFIARSKTLRLVLVVSSLVSLFGLAMTLSRGAWISTAVTGAVFVVLSWRRSLFRRRQLRDIVFVGVTGALLIGVLLGPRIVDRMTASQAGNLEVRFELNKIALRMITAHQFTVIGLNNFILTMEAYDPDDVMEYFPATVHNLYLLEAAEAGIPALLFFVGLMTAIFFTASHRLARIADVNSSWFAIAVLAGLCGFAFSQLADFSHRIEPLRSVLWVNVGLLFGALHTARQIPPTPPGRENHGS